MKENKKKYQDGLKFIIVLFFLISSIMSTYFMFQYMLDTSKSGIENVTLSILYSIGLSAINIFLFGLLALFTNFVFVRLIYSNEIKEAAEILNKDKTNNQNSNQINS